MSALYLKKYRFDNKNTDHHVATRLAVRALLVELEAMVEAMLEPRALMVESVAMVEVGAQMMEAVIPDRTLYTLSWLDPQSSNLSHSLPDKRNF